MGNVLSLLSSVPVTHQTPRGMEEIQNQEPETFQVECAVCLTDRTIFKKMHHSWSPETGHYVCLDCFWSWKRSCTESRAVPNCEQLTCPLCGMDNCYTKSMSVYVACSGCRTLCVNRNTWLTGNTHVAENHPGCTLCWQCITRAEECPICGLEGSPSGTQQFRRPVGTSPIMYQGTDYTSCSINCDFHISMLFHFDEFEILISCSIN